LYETGHAVSVFYSICLCLSRYQFMEPLRAHPQLCDLSLWIKAMIRYFNGHTTTRQADFTGKTHFVNPRLEQ
jgi:hypothetical protein